jgi:hypothetical protein
MNIWMEIDSVQLECGASLERGHSYRVLSEFKLILFYNSTNMYHILELINVKDHLASDAKHLRTTLGPIWSIRAAAQRYVDQPQVPPFGKSRIFEPLGVYLITTVVFPSAD